MMTSINATDQLTTYQNQIAQGAASMPRELGFVDRVGGLVSGIGTLRYRLALLLNRIEGKPEPNVDGVTQTSPGFASLLTDAESELRACLELVSLLSDKF